VIADDVFVPTGRPQIVLDTAWGRNSSVPSAPGGGPVDQIPSVAHLGRLGRHTVMADMPEVDLPSTFLDTALLWNILIVS